MVTVASQMDVSVAGCCLHKSRLPLYMVKWQSIWRVGVVSPLHLDLFEVVDGGEVEVRRVLRG